MPLDEHPARRERLELVNLALGQVLCEPGADLAYAYFPPTSR